MVEIVYYPLSIKRIGRLVYLSFFLTGGIGLIYFALMHKNAFTSLIGFFYFVWGVVFAGASVFLSIPYFYKKVFLAVNSHGVFQKVSFFKKIQFVRWENVKTIRIVDNKVQFELENSEMSVLTEKMNTVDKQKIIEAIKFYVNAEQK